MTSDSGQLFFDIDARHIIQLGMELVADRSTAVAELVKNAYDADATEVTVRFESDRIVIKDNGEGMSLSSVQNAWMRISTNDKEKNCRSNRYHRKRAGQKGIGRFAAQSLGARLLLETTRRHSTEKVLVTFNWDESYTSGADLRSVPNDFQVVQAPRKEHGTRLTIKGLRDTWEDADLRQINDALTLLQPPFPIRRVSRTENADPGFVVRLFSSATEIALSGHDEFLSNATAVVSARVNTTGQVTLKVTSSLLDLNQTSTEAGPKTLAGLRFKAHYYVYAAGAIGGIGTHVAKQMGNRFGGIRVYRNGLRVPPYGDSRDDWLQLDALYRRRTILYPVQNNSWFGFVDISDLEPGLLVDTASREGIVENREFRQLRELIQGAVVWGAGQVASKRQVKLKAGGSRPKQPAESRLTLIKETREQAEEALELATEGSERKARAHLDRMFRELESAARKADELSEERQVELLNEVSLLRVLASLGTSMAVFSHEVRGAINAASASLSEVRETVEGASRPIVRAVDKTISAALDDVGRLRELANYIDAFSSHGRRRKRSRLALYEVIDDFVGNFQKMLGGADAEVDWDVTPPSLRTAPMNRAELESILFNLLTNAVKAMSGDSQGKRRVRLTANEQGDQIALRFEDNGCGIDPSIREKIFDPFFTAAISRDSHLGLGTGLGLKIVADIASSNNGSIRLTKPSRGYATCFELLLPKGKQ